MSDTAPHIKTKSIIACMTAEELFLFGGWGGGLYAGFAIADHSQPGYTLGDMCVGWFGGSEADI